MLEYLSPYQALLSRIRDWAKTQSAPFDIWEVRREMAVGTPNAQYDTTNTFSDFTAGYMAQTLRAVNQLARDGDLVKRNSGRDATYSSPEVQARRDTEAEEAAARVWAARGAWHDIKLRLAAQHYLDIGGSQLTVRLELADWQSILDRLEAAE